MSTLAKTRLSALFAVSAALLLNACLTTKSYVDPVLPKVAATDLKARATPAPLVLKVNFQTMAANASYRAAFINNVVNFLTTYQLDGVDIDWEYPREGNDPANFTVLMTGLPFLSSPGNTCSLLSVRDWVWTSDACTLGRMPEYAE